MFPTIESQLNNFFETLLYYISDSLNLTGFFASNPGALDLINDLKYDFMDFVFDIVPSLVFGVFNFF